MAIGILLYLLCNHCSSALVDTTDDEQLIVLTWRREGESQALADNEMSGASVIDGMAEPCVAGKHKRPASTGGDSYDFKRQITTATSVSTGTLLLRADFE